MEALIDCKRCGSNACYNSKIEGVETYLCWTCGFCTTENHTEGSDILKALEEATPELYKDLKFIDDNKLYWMPSTVTLPNKGMVFVDGTSSKDWKWSAVQAIPLTEEEKKSGKFPPEQVVKMDMQNRKLFDQKDYMSACEAIGMFDTEK